MQQQTILKEGAFTGIALHRGGEVSVRLLPATENSGIVFRRSDLGSEIKSDCYAVGDTHLATTLQNNDVQVGMVEHLLSSLAANGLDNIVVELNGEEVPILDGSAAPWLLFLKGCGRRALPAAKRYIRVLQTVRIEEENDSYASFTPAAGSHYEITIDYPHEVINRTGVSCVFELTANTYAAQIARARTFCYVNDVETMHRYQRALGGSLQNAVVYDDNGVINKSGLRYPDEFVRHKMLDAIGDCYINGYLVLGHYRANKPGHGINNRLMRALMADENAWEWCETDSAATDSAAEKF
ncbi:MAG: UDP-3-O-acyl-N-acetylglucosamine deacetylase [Proteobacteria bacterium]|nr:UDP-3-O-acyl-N-acetylglucosamine deacetylase [Pseudomonadota bacterium]